MERPSRQILKRRTIVVRKRTFFLQPTANNRNFDSPQVPYFLFFYLLKWRDKSSVCIERERGRAVQRKRRWVKGGPRPRPPPAAGSCRLTFSELLLCLYPGQGHRAMRNLYRAHFIYHSVNALL